MRFRISIVAAVCILAMQAAAIDVSNRYRSPRNPERSVRASTQYIVLHTTEAPARSSLNKVSERGECHFVVTEEGDVYRIVDRDREAFHAGRSMWFGKEDVDKFSLGIECVGYHDKPMPMVQLYAIRDLVKELQAMYRISDDRVVAHSHVAYGAPNRWHRCRHRGRKRCGMLFASPTVRRILGLKSRPASDPDVRAHRLQNADELLAKALYGSYDPMRSRYAGGAAPAAPAAPKSWWSKILAPKAASKPAPKTVVKPTPKPAPKTVVKPTPKPAPKPPSAPKSVADLKRLGYKSKGVVSKDRTALKIAGAKWNASTTYYTIRNKVIPGNAIDAAHIEKGMEIWMR